MAKITSRTKFSPYVVLVSLIGLTGMVGCSGTPDDDPSSTTAESTTSTTTNTSSTAGTTSTGTTGGTSMCGAADVPFRLVPDDTQNMHLVSDLKITEIPAAPSSLELTFDWSGVTVDFFGHAVDPTKIVQVALIPWKTDIVSVQNGINVDDPNLQSLADIPAVFDPLATGAPVTSAKITDFRDVGGQPIDDAVLLDYLDPANGFTLTVILQEAKPVGVDARMIQAVKPTVGATTTNIVLTNASSSLEAVATFGTGMTMPAGTSDVLFNYGSLMERSFGGSFSGTGQLVEVIVGKYAMGQDLEGGILDIDYTFENFWRAPGGGVKPEVNLKSLTDASGAAFPGIDANSQYLVGVVCPECTNPSPWFLTAVTPCP